MNSWNGVDFFIFLIFLMNTLLGMARGGLKEFISSFSLIAALVVTIRFTIPITEFMNGSPMIEEGLTSQFVQNFMHAINMPPLTEAMVLQMNYCLAMMILFVLTYSLCDAALAFGSPTEAFGLSVTIVNRKLGIALGAVRGFVISLLFVIIFIHLYEGNVTSVVVNSLRGPAEKLDNLIRARTPEQYQQILQDEKLYHPENVLSVLKNTP